MCKAIYDIVGYLNLTEALYMKYWLPTINPDASLGRAPEGGKLVNTSSDK